MISNEKRRVLDLLAAGQISVEQAESLLTALGSTAAGPHQAEPAAASQSRAATLSSGRRVRSLQIQIDATGKDGQQDKNVSVNIPIGLARFASRFLPPDARVQLDEQGVDLSELISSLQGEVPEGPLMEIDAGEGDKQARITIRAV